MASNVEQIVAVLQATLSADLSQRKQAEDYLTQYAYSKGHVVGLMQVAVAAQAELPMRQAASIHFKNLVAKGWEPRREESARLAEEDKATVRANVLEALIQSPDLIRSQLVECLKVIVNADFPEKWPEILPTLIQYLATDDVPRVYGAVQVRAGEGRGGPGRVGEGRSITSLQTPTPTSTHFNPNPNTAVR